MENKEKEVLDEILQRLNKMESEREIKFRENSSHAGSFNAKDRMVSVTPTTVFMSLFKALIIAVIVYIISLVVINLFSNKNLIDSNSVELSKGKATRDTTTVHDTTIVKPIENSQKIALIKQIDALSVSFAQEVSGETGSRISGYGPRAIAIRKKIDSLKLKLSELDMKQK